MTDQAPTSDAEDLKVRRRFLVYEVLAICGTRLPAIVYAALGFGAAYWFDFLTKDILYSAASQIAWFGVCLFVMFASGDSIHSFGLRRFRANDDVISFVLAIAGICFVLAAVGLSVAQFGESFVWPPQPYKGEAEIMLVGSVAQKHAPLWLLGLSSLLAGVVAEVVFRGYLITRCEELFGSTWQAVLVSAFFFGFVSASFGLTWIVGGFAVGIILGVIFVKYRSVWPLALAHGIANFGITCLLLHHLGAL